MTNETPAHTIAFSIEVGGLEPGDRFMFTDGDRRTYTAGGWFTEPRISATLREITADDGSYHGVTSASTVVTYVGPDGRTLAHDEDGPVQYRIRDCATNRRGETDLQASARIAVHDFMRHVTDEDGAIAANVSDALDALRHALDTWTDRNQDER